MLYRPSSFRKKATAFAAAAAIFGTAVTYTAASAQDVASNSDPSSTCSQKFGPTDAGVRCAIRQLDKDIADAKVRRATAEKKLEAADQEATCLNLIMNDLGKNGPKTANLTAVPPKGQACKTARDLKLISG
jgi:hypothetical protein